MTDQQRIAAITARCEAATKHLAEHKAGGWEAHYSRDMSTALAEIDRLTEAQRWIPITERLPEIDVAVLVLHKYHRDEYNPVTIGRLYQPCDRRRKPYWTFVSIQASDGAVYNDGTDFICPGSEYVTHWQPLPAAPEKGDSHDR